MKVGVTGGSGFIGSKLTEALARDKHEPMVFDVREPSNNVAFQKVDLMKELDSHLFSGVDAVIHLAGASIFKRWTKETKKLIYDTRIETTRNIVLAIQKAKRPPRILITASAVGYYGDRGDEVLTEKSIPGSDFLANLCQDWEEAAGRAEELGIRVVHVRTAPVLGRGGLLGTLLPLYRCGLGGPLGNGKQWFPWVHVKDIVGGYVHALQNDINGPLNVVAPHHVRNHEFSEFLAKKLNRPAIIPTPRWALRLAYNEFADAILASQRVSAQRIQTLGYQFSFADLDAALVDVLRK